MFDASYFKQGLAAHADGTGAEATVDLHLRGGPAHRVQTIVEAADGYVVIDAYRHRLEPLASSKEVFQGKSSAKNASTEVHRVVIAYESIVQVIITPVDPTEHARIGFGLPG